MDYTKFLEEVRTHLGRPDTASLDRAIHATMRVLGQLVGPDHRAILAAALPEELADAFRAAEHDARLGRHGFVARVAASEDVPEKRALEHATAVLTALASTLAEDARRVLERELPEDVRDWVRRKEEHFPPRHPHGASGAVPASRHLSEARPGSRHPVSESAPRGAHSGSVSASPDPHADTKLSTAPGTTQEREHETLAEGEPRPERPLSEAGD